MKILRSKNLGFSLVAMTVVAAIILTLLSTSTIFYHSEWLALTGLALFVLAGLPALRGIARTAPAVRSPCSSVRRLRLLPTSRAGKAGAIGDAHQGMFFLSTVQPSFLARPGGLPVKSLPASASPLNCHWSHATEAIAQSPPWG